MYFYLKSIFLGWTLTCYESKVDGNGNDMQAIQCEVPEGSKDSIFCIVQEVDTGDSPTPPYRGCTTKEMMDGFINQGHPGKNSCRILGSQKVCLCDSDKCNKECPFECNDPDAIRSETKAPEPTTSKTDEKSNSGSLKINFFLICLKFLFFAYRSVNEL